MKIVTVAGFLAVGAYAVGITSGVLVTRSLADCGGCIDFDPGPWRPPSRAWVAAILEVHPDGTITRRGKPLAELTRAELEQVVRDLAGDVVTERGR